MVLWIHERLLTSAGIECQIQNISLRDTSSPDIFDSSEPSHISKDATANA